MELLQKNSFFSSVTKQRESVQRLVYIEVLLIIADVMCLFMLEYRVYAWTRIALLYVMDQYPVSRYMVVACSGELACAWWSHHVVIYDALAIIGIGLLMWYLRENMVKTTFAATVRICCVMTVWYYVTIMWLQVGSCVITGTLFNCTGLMICAYLVYRKEQ